MNKAIARLAYTRHVVAERETMLAEAEIELHASPLWARFEDRQESLQRAKGKRTEAEINVRIRALAAYGETGDKTPHPAVKIKMFTVLDYLSYDALDYAREHLPKVLKLHKQAFEKAARVLELDFVAITQEPRATIARDLSEYLRGQQCNQAD